MPDLVTNTMVDVENIKSQLIEDDGTLSVVEQTTETIRVVPRTVRYTSHDTGHSLIVGHASYGKIGSGYNGPDSTQLLLGVNLVGVEEMISSHDNEFWEGCRHTDFVDTDNTSATVNTTLFKITF